MARKLSEGVRNLEILQMDDGDDGATKVKIGELERGCFTGEEVSRKHTLTHSTS